MVKTEEKVSFWSVGCSERTEKRGGGGSTSKPPNAGAGIFIIVTRHIYPELGACYINA